MEEEDEQNPTLAIVGWLAAAALAAAFWVVVYALLLAPNT